MMSLHGQTEESGKFSNFFFTPEILLGKTMEANTDFPKTTLQKGLFLNFGTQKRDSNLHWVRVLGFPKTGLSLGITEFGNIEKIGIAYSVMPFAEFDLFKKKTDRWSLHLGFGAGYIDTKYDPEMNPNNLAVTTSINWSYKSFLYYRISKGELYNWRLGLGYAHFSNGHTRLPNQGLNSFLISASLVIGKDFYAQPVQDIDKLGIRNRIKEYYFETRGGIGQNVLSRVFNTKKEVFSMALSGGTIVNRTFKFGGGVYYRFYEHYYDYIKEGGQLVQEQRTNYRNHPYRYATNIGLFGSAELLLGHVGVEFNLGVNIYKPFYKFDWQLSQGFYQNGTYLKLGELDDYYKLKKIISSRMGLRYYLLNTAKALQHNFFLGAHINANLGQADFSELSLGYVYRFTTKRKSKTKS